MLCLLFVIGTLYAVRRKYILPAPDSQFGLDLSKEWFTVNGESIVIGDKVRSFVLILKWF